MNSLSHVHMLAQWGPRLQGAGDDGMQCGCAAWSQMKYLSPLLWGRMILREVPLREAWQHCGANSARSTPTSDTWLMSSLSSHGDNPTQGRRI